MGRGERAGKRVENRYFVITQETVLIVLILPNHAMQHLCVGGGHWEYNG